MTRSLRVLIVEDVERDAELLVLELERGGYASVVKRVDTLESMNAALDNGPWDLVISDYSMPGFTGLAALQVIQQRGLDLPFLIVSGTIGEDLAVAAMKAGAHDYIMKGGFSRLIPAIERELREAAERDKRREAEARLRESEEQYRGLVETSPDSITLVDLAGTVLRTNQQGALLFGFESPEQMVGMSAFEMIAPEDRQRAVDDKQKTGHAGSIRALEYTMVRRDKSTFPAEVTGALLRDSEGKPKAFVSLARDISERKRAEQALTYRAMYDALTDLPNRMLLHDRMTQAIDLALRDASQVAFFLFDLDRFKEINDTFGHHYGDLLLRQIGPRIRSVLRECDTTARLGGDEFALLLPATDEVGARAVADKVLTALEQPFRIEGQRFYISGSIGIALYPQHAKDAGSLLQRADVAMYLAKASDTGYAVYDAARDEYSPSKLALYGQLRQAIDGNQLVLNYQPKADMRTGHVQSAEALVRWQHPERGMIPPDSFIPLAEHTGLIKPLTSWVLNEALRQHRTWRSAGMDIALAVNISARTLHDSRLATTIADSLVLCNVVPSRLMIEITESALMLDPDRALEILTQLHDLGVGIAIDDFGTGYSSLAYLKRLPVDEIKIDRSFVTSLSSDDDDAVIVRSIIQLAHNLGLTTVAEGVQDAESWTMLREMGCDAVQGYYLSRPLSSEDCGAWLANSFDRVAS